MIRTREHPRRFWSCCSSPRQEVRVPAEFLKAADITEPRSSPWRVWRVFPRYLEERGAPGEPSGSRRSVGRRGCGARARSARRTAPGGRRHAEQTGDLLPKWHAGDDIHALPAFASLPGHRTRTTAFPQPRTEPHFTTTTKIDFYLKPARSSDILAPFSNLPEAHQFQFQHLQLFVQNVKFSPKRRIKSSKTQLKSKYMKYSPKQLQWIILRYKN